MNRHGKHDEPWDIAGASVRGASHLRSGIPNQDAAQWFLAPDRHSFAVAVADGHGARLHSRSQRGAQFAVAVAIAEVRSRIDERPDAPLGRNLGELTARLLQRWREAVQADVERDPLGAEQCATLARHGLDATGAYGTTLLAAGVGAASGFVIQIGDGHSFFVTREGAATAVLPSHDFPGDATYSLCLPEALDLIEARPVETEELGHIAGIVLSTDGYGKSFRDDGAAAQVKTMVKRLGRESAAVMTPELETWLNRVSEIGSGDDISVVIAARSLAQRDR